MFQKRELPVPLQLWCDTFGDGSLIETNWFRVIERQVYMSTRFMVYQEQRRSFGIRTSRSHSEEEPDGHCGRRALARQLFQCRGTRLADGTGGVAHVHIRTLTAEIVAGLRAYSPQLVEATASFAARNSQDVERRKRRAAVYLAQRASRLEALDFARGCDVDDWFGGYHSCDAFALAAQTNQRVFIIGEGELGVSVYGPDFRVHTIKLAMIQHRTQRLCPRGVLLRTYESKQQRAEHQDH